MNQVEQQISFPVPFNEQDRLEALYKLHILDTEANEDIDRIVRLASAYFKVPIALVSLIDKHRQWFKSCIGLEGQTETDRNIAFCTHAILQDDVMVVPDATEDDRFKNNPLVTGEPFIRFYAGRPLKSPDGYNLGTLCIIDTKARPDLTDDEKIVFGDYADAVANLLYDKKLKIEAEDKSNAKTEFLSHISHELRTPLNAICGISNILKSKNNLDEQSASMVRTLSVSANSLLELVNSVLDISAIEARSFNLSDERFSLPKLIDEVGSIMGARAMEKGLAFTQDYSSVKDMYFNGDKLRLKQVLMNLLGNAIKFTDQGAVTLTVHYKSSESDNPSLEFQVIDSGIGIPQDKIETIFTRFNRAHTHMHYEGTGLGLSISKEIVDHMGGTMKVESREGFGTKFYVTIPYRSQVRPTKPQSTDSSSDMFEPKIVAQSSEYKILIAEDYIPNTTLIKYMMEDFGYHYKIVNNGQQVLDALEEEPYDLVLMDISMPVMDGVEATQVIRNSSKFYSIPIIAMSAHVFEDEREICFKAGVTDYITKPLDIDTLFDKMEAHLKQQEVQTIS